MPNCLKCKIILTLDNSYKNTGNICKECVKVRVKQHTNLVREQVLNYYGATCELCGESNFSFLVMDHINGGGSLHRRTEKAANYIYLYIKKNNYPKNFRVLCHNCNHKISKTKINKSARYLKYRLALKADIINNYGGKCACCGLDDSSCLSIDHIFGGGRKQENCASSTSLYIYLRKNGYPKDKYQLLCMNCNCAKGFYSSCPHKIKKEN